MATLLASLLLFLDSAAQAAATQGPTLEQVYQSGLAGILHQVDLIMQQMDKKNENNRQENEDNRQEDENNRQENKDNMQAEQEQQEEKRTNKESVPSGSAAGGAGHRDPARGGIFIPQLPSDKLDQDQETPSKTQKKEAQGSTPKTPNKK